MLEVYKIKYLSTNKTIKYLNKNRITSWDQTFYKSEKIAICKALLPYFVSLILGFAPYFKSNFTVSNDVIPFVNGLCDSIAM